MARVDPNIPTRLRIDRDKVAEFCRRWKITELAFLGSVREDRFDLQSDVDVLVTFSPQTEWGLFDWVAMAGELAAIRGRRADLVSRRPIERSSNPIRRREIPSGARPYYVA